MTKRPWFDDRTLLRRYLQLAALFFFCLPAAPAVAHPEGFSGLRITILEDRIHASLTLHTRDIGAWFPPGKFPDYVPDVTRAMGTMIDEIIELQVDGRPLEVEQSNAFLLEVGLIEVDVAYLLPSSTGQVELLVWSKHLIYLPRGHQQLLIILDSRQVASDTEEGIVLLEEVLTMERDAGAILLSIQSRGPPVVDHRNDEPPFEESSSERKPIAQQATQEPARRVSFYALGIEHIVTGYDHLLFLAALLLACNRFREAATIITCFTVAHSITLALAALDVLNLPTGLIEPAIALSIVFVAVENLIGTPATKQRVAITCFFGLIHGLGFASALREIGLGTIPGGILWPLLKFNLGVETGQLFVTAILFPLFMLARRTERRKITLMRYGSMLVAVFGVYWFVARIAAQIFSG